MRREIRPGVWSDTDDAEPVKLPQGVSVMVKLMGDGNMQLDCDPAQIPVAVYVNGRRYTRADDL